MRRILDQRTLFVSQRAATSFSRYAYAQIKRARGRKKRVHNPQPREIPRREAFCWFIPWPSTTATVSRDPALPCRPRPLLETGLDLHRYHAAALEHAPHVYRLYEYSEGARGVFRQDMLVCESIPKADERPRFRGLLIYNQPAWEKALRQWRQY